MTQSELFLYAYILGIITVILVAVPFYALSSVSRGVGETYFNLLCSQVK